MSDTKLLVPLQYIALTTSQRNSLSPGVGTTIFNTTLGYIQTWNGSAWDDSRVPVNALPTLASSDPTVAAVSTVGSVTTLDVSGVQPRIPWIFPVDCHAAAPLAGSPVYANGTLGVGATLTQIGTFGAFPAVDGVTLGLSGRILVNAQALTGVTSVATTGIFTKTAHNLIANEAVVPTANVLDSFLTVGTTYYVSATNLTPNAFSLSATVGGSVLTGTTNDTNLTLRTPAKNGVYILTVVGASGSPGTAWVLTRDTTFDQAAEMVAGAQVRVANGIGWKGNTFTLMLSVTTVGTDPINFSTGVAGGAIRSFLFAGAPILAIYPDGFMETALDASVLRSAVGVLSLAGEWDFAGGAGLVILNGTNKLYLDSAGTAARTITFPDRTDTVVTLGGAQTLSSKTMTAPVLGAATATSLALSSFLNEAKGTDIASSATTDIGAAIGNYVNITGTTTITALGTVQAGTRRILNFNGALTIVYNATSLILPGAGNITTVAGDIATFVSLGSGNWVCTSYTKMTVTGTGSAVLGNTPSLVTPNIGAATGTSLAATGLIKSSGTAGIGYATGAGDAQSQSPNKNSGVTSNAICGTITMSSQALASGASIAFTVTNSTVANTDTVIACIKSGAATSATYQICVDAVSTGSFRIHLRNVSVGSLSEALLINFAIIKSVSA